MIKYFCDICKKETYPDDLATLEIKSEQDEKPKIQPLEVCVFCQAKIKDFITQISEE